MADIVSLSLAKAHLRVTQSSEDTLITLYIAAAQEYLRNFLNRRIPGEDEDPANIPAPLQGAALLLIGGMYEQRSDKIVGTIVADNPAVMNLAYPYRVEMGV